jgi:hypothetical protein
VEWFTRETHPSAVPVSGFKWLLAHWITDGKCEMSDVS